MGYHFAKGTTEITYFHGDMHTYSIRADKVLNSYADMKEVVERFEADRSQFDYTDYFEGATNHKSARGYTVLITKDVSFEEIVFEFGGKEFKTKTTKFSVISKIRKNADKILSHYQVFAVGLVDDATGEVLAINKLIRELDLLGSEDYLSF
jgi:hypothetical protein